MFKGVALILILPMPTVQLTTNQQDSSTRKLMEIILAVELAHAHSHAQEDHLMDL